MRKSAADPSSDDGGRYEVKRKSDGMCDGVLRVVCCECKILGCRADNAEQHDKGCGVGDCGAKTHTKESALQRDRYEAAANA